MAGCFGILGAMQEEIELLCDRIENIATVSVGHTDVYTGTLFGKPVALVACAMGKVSAAASAQLLIDRFNVDKLVFTGVAGSLDSTIDIGDIVVSSDCVQHDLDASGLGYAKGSNPDTGMSFFPADERLRTATVEAAHAVCPEVGVREGRVATGDQFVSSSEQKQRIVDEFHALCCEMEGAAMAQVAWLNDIPYVVVRAISDKADEEGEIDFRSFLSSSAHRCADIVSYLVEHSS